jgi:hypothetical protein
MSAMKSNGGEPVLNGLADLLPNLEELYKDVHAHPELSMEETRTAGLAAHRLRDAGYEVTTEVGKTGSSASFATVMALPSCCAPTWTRCRSNVREQDYRQGQEW